MTEYFRPYDRINRKPDDQIITLVKPETLGNIHNNIIIYLHFYKYIDSVHLCYIFLAGYPSPAYLSPESLYLVP